MRRAGGEHQGHRHVGGVLGQHARRIGDGDAALARGVEVDVVDAGAERGDQLQPRPGLREHPAVDAVGDRRDQDVRGLHRLDQLAGVSGLSSALSRVSNSSMSRVSMALGRVRVTITSGFFFGQEALLPR
jgi:hypothetical protein